MCRLVFFLIFVAQPAIAADSITEPSLLGASLKMAAALAVVIGILLLLYAASRKGFKVLPQKEKRADSSCGNPPIGGTKISLCGQGSWRRDVARDE